MWDKTVPSVTCQDHDCMLKRSGMAAFFPKALQMAVLVQLCHAWSYPQKNLYKIQIFCCITVKFKVGLGKTSGCSPIVFFSPQPYAKVTFKTHIWGEKLGRHTIPSLSLHSSSYYSVTAALTEILTVVGVNSECSLSNYSKWFKNSFQFTLGMLFLEVSGKKLPDRSLPCG